MADKAVTPVESKEEPKEANPHAIADNANVKFLKSPNVYGYGNFVGDVAYVNPEHIITVPVFDKTSSVPGATVEGKFEDVSALEFFLKHGICEKY